MARINIEDTLYRDERFIKLCGALKNRAEAIGYCVIMWDLAQHWFTRNPSNVIPFDAWKKANIPPAIIELGLAEMSDCGVYVKGSREQFHWIKERKEAARRGGLKSQRNRLKQNRAKQSKTNPSSSSSSSSSASASKNKDMTSGDDAPLHRLAQLWNEHCGSLPKVKACGVERSRKIKARWGEAPDEQYWIQVIQKIAASRFCNGNGPDSWRASFDFLIQPETQHKALEGKYDSASQTRFI